MNSELETLKTEYETLRAQLEIARLALKQINEEEINSMRPGGGYSRSASISYQTLAKLEELEK